jgi:Protein of unknown function (DUF2585)
MTNPFVRCTEAVAAQTRKMPAWAFVLIGASLLAIQAGTEHALGRVTVCTCGTIKLWVGGSQNSEISQQIFDWYSLSHLIHGFGLYGLTWLALPRAPVAARLVLAMLVECGWEILENSSFIIDRYRSETISLNYYGDSILNSLSDTLTMMFGFGLAYWLPVWSIVLAAVLMEALAGYVIRDNLTLNIIMLIYPLDAIRSWQGGVIGY